MARRVPEPSRRVFSPADFFVSPADMPPGAVALAVGGQGQAGALPERAVEGRQGAKADPFGNRQRRCVRAHQPEFRVFDPARGQIGPQGQPGELLEPAVELARTQPRVLPDHGRGQRFGEMVFDVFQAAPEGRRIEPPRFPAIVVVGVQVPLRQAAQPRAAPGAFRRAEHRMTGGAAARPGRWFPIAPPPAISSHRSPRFSHPWNRNLTVPRDFIAAAIVKRSPPHVNLNSRCRGR